MKKKLLFIIAVLTINISVLGQSYFKDYRNGEQFFAEQKYNEAIESFTNVINAKNDHDRAYNYRGLCYLNTEAFDKAAADFKKALEIKEKTEEYHLNFGKALSQLQKYDEAIAAFDIAIDRDKKLVGAYQEKTLAQMKAKRFMDAVSTAEQLLSIEKNGANYYLLGVAQDSSKMFKEAAYSYDRAKFYDSKLVGAYIGLAHSNMKLNKYEDALKHADKALELSPDNIEALRVRSATNEANKNLQAAIDDYSKIVLIEPSTVYHYITRAELYEKIGQNPNAIADYTKAISINKENANLYFKRGALHEKMSNFKAAIKDYEDRKSTRLNS